MQKKNNRWRELCELQYVRTVPWLITYLHIHLTFMTLTAMSQNSTERSWVTKWKIISVQIGFHYFSKNCMFQFFSLAYPIYIIQHCIPHALLKLHFINMHLVDVACQYVKIKFAFHVSRNTTDKPWDKPQLTSSN